MTSVLLRGARLTARGPLRDLLVSGGRVTGSQAPVGDRAQIEVVDVDGRFVLPGLWDRHVHFDQWAQVSARIDLTGADSARAAARLAGSRVMSRTTDLETPVVGYGFRDALWPDAPHHDLLDETCGSAPVVLISADLHSAWLNTAALNRYAQSDHPSGLLREGAAMRVMVEIGRTTDDVADAWCRDAAVSAAARGVVGVVDMEQPWSLAAWRRRISDGNSALRVISAVWPERLDAAIDQGFRTGDVVAETDGLLSIGPLKVISDGSLNTRTAFCHDPYATGTESDDESGLLLVASDALIHLMVRARDAGFETAVHAIGDAANSLALDAFAATGARGSIEHAQLLDDADLGRFAALGLTASVQPEHALDDRDVADRYWPGRTRRAFALRSLLDAGAVLAFGSDAPVAPLDPWLAIGAAVHRSRDERPSWHPEQEITLVEALTASMPSLRGGIELQTGDPADLMILDGDPFTADPRTLRSMPVAATMAAGRWTHRAGV